MRKKINIKEYIVDEDSIDLSLNDIQEIPVKEIASAPKATRLDLSDNHITVIGNNFCTSLVHLVKLDLCRNQIVELPENFGLLVHLKHLDLYMNKIQTLPLSFCHLRALRWLDLKENPLIPSLSKVVGYCQDAAACQSAAKNAVKYLGELNRQAEEENFKKEEQRRKSKQLEEKELHSSQKKDSKKKKKKKNNSKTIESVKEEVVFNGKMPVDKSKTDSSATKQLNKSKSDSGFLSSVQSFIGIILKAIFFSILLCALVLFAIKLFDEPTYNVVTTSLLKKFNHYKLQIYKKTPAELNNVYLIVYEIFKSIRASIQISFVRFWKSVKDAYTNENISMYLDIIRENFNIGYIKTVDTLSVSYAKIVEYVSSYSK